MYNPRSFILNFNVCHDSHRMRNANISLGLDALHFHAAISQCLYLTPLHGATLAKRSISLYHCHCNDNQFSMLIVSKSPTKIKTLTPNIEPAGLDLRILLTTKKLMPQTCFHHAKIAALAKLFGKVIRTLLYVTSHQQVTNNTSNAPRASTMQCNHLPHSKQEYPTKITHMAVNYSNKNQRPFIPSSESIQLFDIKPRSLDEGSNPHFQQFVPFELTSCDPKINCTPLPLTSQIIYYSAHKDHLYWLKRILSQPAPSI